MLTEGASELTTTVMLSTTGIATGSSLDENTTPRVTANAAAMINIMASRILAHGCLCHGRVGSTIGAMKCVAMKTSSSSLSVTKKASGMRGIDGSRSVAGLTATSA